MMIMMMMMMMMLRIEQGSARAEGVKMAGFTL